VVAVSMGGKAENRAFRTRLTGREFNPATRDYSHHLSNRNFVGPRRETSTEYRPQAVEICAEAYVVVTLRKRIAGKAEEERLRSQCRRTGCYRT
jgi:hypothetical protein